MSQNTESRRKDMRQTLLILLVTLLAACQSKNLREAQGQPPAYQDGYHQGCDSGYVAAGNDSYQFRKDVKRFAQENYYQQGWTDGYNSCKSKYESIRRR
jgi:DNA-binding transcriptional regulator of glucitol operon